MSTRLRLRQIVTGAAALATALMALVMLGSAPAFADQVTCGETITHSVTLTNDLINCPGDGVVIGAANLTIDLNGHTVAGVGSDAAGTGILSEGYTATTVEGGTVQDFRWGIQLRGGDNTLRDLDVTGNRSEGIQVIDAEGHSVIERNLVSGNASGGLLVVSDSNQIRSNDFLGNGGAAIVVSDSTANVIERNRIIRNRPSPGSFVGAIRLIRTSATLITRNLITESSFGIDVVDSGNGTRIEKNDVPSNQVGLRVIDSGGTLISKNLVNSNLYSGIAVVDAPALIVKNTANRNGSDGIVVSDERDTVTKNRADYNGEYGIEAIPGVSDGGGNRAFGNGNPLQCLYVECK